MPYKREDIAALWRHAERAVKGLRLTAKSASRLYDALEEWLDEYRLGGDPASVEGCIAAPLARVAAEIEAFERVHRAVAELKAHRQWLATTESRPLNKLTPGLVANRRRAVAGARRRIDRSSERLRAELESLAALIGKEATRRYRRMFEARGRAPAGTSGRA